MVILPAFNEARAIGAVVAELLRRYDYPVVVVDDASTDDTVALARQAGARVIPLACQLGAWGAIQTGLRFARNEGYHTAMTMDADGQHDAASLPQLLEPVAKGRCDVAIGACTRRGSALRQAAWVLMKKVSGLGLEDITSGLRAYNWRAINVLSQRRASLLDYQDVGVLLLLKSEGLEIADVEVVMHDRRHGRSRIFSSWGVVMHYMAHTLLLGLTKRSLGSGRRRPRAAARG